MNAQEPTTTRPYLIRALHEWCIDNGFTPYIAVRVDSSVQVPREFVKDGEIVLNVGLGDGGGSKGVDADNNSAVDGRSFPRAVIASAVWLLL